MIEDLSSGSFGVEDCFAADLFRVTLEGVGVPGDLASSALTSLSEAIANKDPKRGQSEKRGKGAKRNRAKKQKSEGACQTLRKVFQESYNRPKVV